MSLEHTMQEIAPVGHTASLTTLIVAWAGLLSPVLTVIATSFTILWVTICVWESETCKGWRLGLRHWKNNKIMKHRARRFAKLKALELKMQAKIEAAKRLAEARADARGVLIEATAKAASIVAHEPVDTASKLTPPIS